MNPSTQCGNGLDHSSATGQRSDRGGCPASPQCSQAIARRRTFAIISHPDAGKTTLTEKLLLYGGAIHLAGRVKARGEQRRARSDWMTLERERGISVTASAMTYEYGGCMFNLLDTPGHEDFCEDTYRTLTAVDSAVMVIDAAKGIEARTLKLFEVCRLKNVPILTYINKLDRDSRDPLDLLSEIEKRLALDVAPVTWPVGMGRELLGCYDLVHRELLLLARSARDIVSEGLTMSLEDPELDRHLPGTAARLLKSQIGMVQGLCPLLFARCLSRRPSHSGVLRQRSAEFWSARAPARVDRIRSQSPAPERFGADGAAVGISSHGIRLQDTGQHGSAPSGPNGIPSGMLRPVPPRNEAFPRAERQNGISPQPCAPFCQRP
jgi:small GTP-binding protein